MFKKWHLERRICREFSLTQSKFRYKELSKYYSNFNANFYVFVNFNYQAARIEFGLSLTSKLDEPRLTRNYGIDTTNSNIRECIYFETIDNEKTVLEMIGKFIREYEQMSKENIKSLMKAKRDHFRDLVNSKLKTLGFRRKYNTWEYLLEHYRINLYLAKYPYADLYDFYCWVYGIDSPPSSFAFVHERMLGTDQKTILFDWILDEDLFLKSLDSFIRDIITPLLKDNIESLSFYKAKPRSRVWEEMVG